MNKKTIALVIFGMLLSGLVGYGQGYADGINYSINKMIDAVNVVFDIKLTDKAKDMAVSYSQIIDRIPSEVRIKLGLNDSAYQEQRYKQINETIAKLIETKYGK